MIIFLALLAAVPIAIVQGSFFEWAFHRYWLHRPWLPEACFRSHTMIHHQLCKYEDTFHVESEEQHEALTFAWWGGPALVAINIAPWLLATWGLIAAGVTLPYMAFLITFAVTVALYYVGYEGLHYLMHKPTFPFIEHSGFFKFIKRHHAIHHVYMDKNLNVLLPIADFCLGSLVLVPPRAMPTRTGEGARITARKFSRFGQRLEHDTEAERQTETASNSR